MKIKSLQINNFRGIEQLELNFSQRTTVLVGINGVGKTAILECLAILLFYSLLNRITHPGNFLNVYKRSDFYSDANQIRNQITIYFEKHEVTLVNTSSKNGKNTFLSSGSQKQVKSIIEKIQSNLDNNPKASIPLVIYYPVNRAIFDVDMSLNIIEKPDFHQFTALDWAFYDKYREFPSFFEWFRNREDIENEERLNSDGEYRDTQLEAVRKAVQSLMPDYSDLRVRRSPLRMTLMKQGHELIINQLSDGEKCLLALTGDLARRLAIANPALPNPLYGQAIVLIDEVELHLHPQWQRQVIPALENTFPNCQFVVSTHSPQVISEVQRQERNVYFLRSTAEGIVAEINL